MAKEPAAENESPCRKVEKRAGQKNPAGPFILRGATSQRSRSKLPLDAAERPQNRAPDIRSLPHNSHRGDFRGVLCGETFCHLPCRIDARHGEILVVDSRERPRVHLATVLHDGKRDRPSCSWALHDEPSVIGKNSSAIFLKLSTGIFSISKYSINRFARPARPLPPRPNRSTPTSPPTTTLKKRSCAALADSSRNGSVFSGRAPKDGS